MTETLIDAGPLVAIVLRRDEHHEAAIELFGSLRKPPITCWPAITEAVYLARHHPRSVEALIEMLQDGSIAITNLIQADIAPVAELMRKYRNLQLQLADACLLQLADRLDLQHIFTFDQRDFTAALTPAGRTLKRLEARP
ncbi:MAG: PIN domain-containing protein [Planctomycetota bacterium]